MMKTVATFLLTLAFAGLCLGQKNDKPKVSIIWSSDPGCHHSNPDEVKAAKPKCSSVQIDTETTFYIIEFEGVTYAMSHRPVRDYLVASVQVSNKGQSPIDINPKRARLARFGSQADYAGNSRPVFASAQSQDDLRKATYQEGEIGERDGGIRSGLRKRDRHEVDYNRGRVITRPGASIDEPEAPPTEAPMPSRISSDLLVPKVVFDNILKSKTLSVGEKAAGHLVFKHPPEDKSYLVLYLNVAQMDFIFPSVPK
jgi:hypothetical protein